MVRTVLALQCVPWMLRQSPFVVVQFIYLFPMEEHCARTGIAAGRNRLSQSVVALQVPISGSGHRDLAPPWSLVYLGANSRSTLDLTSIPTSLPAFSLPRAWPSLMLASTRSLGT